MSLHMETLIKGFHRELDLVLERKTSVKLIKNVFEEKGRKV